MKKFYCFIILVLGLNAAIFAQKSGVVNQDKVHHFIGLINGNATPSSIVYFVTHYPEETIYAIRNQMVDANIVIEGIPLAFHSMKISGDVEDREECALRMVKAFVQQGWNVNSVDNSNSTILFWAVDNNFLTVVDFLLQSKIDVTVKNKWGETALIYACSSKYRSKAASKLIATKKGLDITDDRGDTALVNAMDDKLLDIAKELINAGADVNIHGKESYSPLYRACDRANLELVKLLVSKGAKINEKSGYSNQTPLFEAMYPDNYELVKFLLEKGADPNAKDKNGNTPMFSLNSCKDKRIPEIMIKYGGDINLKNNEGDTPFLDVVRFCNTTCIEVFKQHKPNYKVVTKAGTTLLHELMLGSLPHEVYGISDSEGWVSGEFNIKVFESVVNDLLTNGVDINAKDKDGNTALMMACDMNYDIPGYAEILVKNGSKLDIQDKYKRTALMMAIGKPKIMQLIIDNGANINLKDSEGKTAYDMAVARSSYGSNKDLTQCVQILYNANPSASKNVTLHEALLSGNAALAKDLLKKCKDINEKDSKGQSLLYCAVKSQNAECVSLVLEKKPDFSKSVYENSENIRTTPLICAIKDRQTQIVELLLKAGADPNEKGTDEYITDFTPLSSMFYLDSYNSKNRADITKLLIQYGADPNTRFGNRNATDFMYIAEHSTNELFEYVLNNCKVDLLLTDDDGKTVIDYADDWKREDKMKSYLKKQWTGKSAVCTDNLRLRGDAGLYSTVLTTLKKGSLVKIIDVSYIEKIDGIVGCFVQVEVGAGAKDSSGKPIAKGTKGWCFSGYLEIK